MHQVKFTDSVPLTGQTYSCQISVKLSSHARFIYTPSMSLFIIGFKRQLHIVYEDLDGRLALFAPAQDEEAEENEESQSDTELDNNDDDDADNNDEAHNNERHANNSTNDFSDTQAASQDNKESADSGSSSSSSDPFNDPSEQGTQLVRDNDTAFAESDPYFTAHDDQMGDADADADTPLSQIAYLQTTDEAFSYSKLEHLENLMASHT